MISSEEKENGGKTSADFAVDRKMDPNILATVDPGLARVVAAWPKVPEAIRRAISARLMRDEGTIDEHDQPTDEEIRRFDKQRKNKKVSNAEWQSKAKCVRPSFIFVIRCIQQTLGLTL